MVSPQAFGAPGGPALLELVVPAFNEEDRLPAGLAALCAKLAELRVRARVIVVDNASTDATPDIVRDWPASPVPVRLVRCAVKGKGAAVRTGLLATTAPLVGFCDVDMATDLSALDPAMALLGMGYAAVIGSRADPASVVEARHSPLRRVGAKVFRGLARQIVGDIGDTQCGFKLFRGTEAREVAALLRCDGFAFDVELLARFRARGLAVREIPVHWRDMSGSTFSCLRHGIGVFAEMGAIWRDVGLASGVRHLPAPRASYRDSASTAA
ncbi:glycosyltransferase family 2 protein [Sphaerisporangium rubeum]|uniref:Glycosyltransferase involved in cell wall biosynthesis n=1 Tax=Sphaerisporangium rubeum TaxID=321317 RepID=A0A7X0M4Z3_9ACTN|nr:glycosyltransferase [Sphaerisporangium rubeum]MBB6472128.1 glycosyltransferase involved in cell wall biosynthesis [Sphaerisporangium rubeum]